jgi:hypothetical protein
MTMNKPTNHQTDHQTSTPTSTRSLRTDNTIQSPDTQAQIAQHILSNPSTSNWMKRALESAMARDPVDAARDACELAQILQARSISAMGAALQRRIPDGHTAEDTVWLQRLNDCLLHEHAQALLDIADQRAKDKDQLRAMAHALQALAPNHPTAS